MEFKKNEIKMYLILNNFCLKNHYLFKFKFRLINAFGLKNVKSEYFEQTWEEVEIN